VTGYTDNRLILLVLLALAALVLVRKRPEWAVPVTVSATVTGLAFVILTSDLIR